MRALLFSLFVLLFAAGCGRGSGLSLVSQTVQLKYDDVPHVSTDSLAQWLHDETETRPLLLDVRSAEEYAVSHLPGAQRVDPGETTFTFLEHLPHDHPVVTYCAVGYRSAALAQRLREAGYTNVHNLSGSIFAWALEERPLERNGQMVHQVHPYDDTWGLLLPSRLRSTGAE